MIIHVKLPDGAVFSIEAQGKQVGSLAEQAAAQVDAHRDGAWTLAVPSGRLLGLWPKILDEQRSAEDAGLADGDEVILYQRAR